MDWSDVRYYREIYRSVFKPFFRPPFCYVSAFQTTFCAFIMYIRYSAMLLYAIVIGIFILHKNIICMQNGLVEVKAT